MATKLQAPLNTLSFLALIDDPRVDRPNKHRLLEILFIGLVATICGGNTWVRIVRFARVHKRYIRPRGFRGLLRPPED
jgi:hypothetical protein